MNPTVYKSKAILKTIAVNIFIIAFIPLFLELVVRIYTNASSTTSRYNISRYISALFNQQYDTPLNSSSLRHPTPYIAFKGQPLVGDHDASGYRTIDPDSKHLDSLPNTIKIAFYGGSTGYLGNPPIPTLLAHNLRAKQIPVSIQNFSIVSSNHNQHMHSMLEDLPLQHYDLILFYGGYNELLQPAFYDPRPGYPYNFALTETISPELQVIYKHSILFRLIVRKIYGNESIFASGYKNPIFGDTWSDSITSNYLSVLKKSSLVAKTLTSGRCKTPFIVVLQPFQLSQSPPSFRKRVIEVVGAKIQSIPYAINLSSKLPELLDNFTDIVHLDDSGNQFIAKQLSTSPILMNALASCEPD